MVERHARGNLSYQGIQKNGRKKGKIDRERARDRIRYVFQRYVHTDLLFPTGPYFLIGHSNMNLLMD